VREKLIAAGADGLLHTSRGVGYRLVAPSQP
jgi:DNA-binding response OmpR family regulator